MAALEVIGFPNLGANFAPSLVRFHTTPNTSARRASPAVVSVQLKSVLSYRIGSRPHRGTALPQCTYQPPNLRPVCR